MSLLQIDKMTHYFGGLRAVYNYGLEINPGQIRGLIGPNGAGKTTIFNLITGIYQPTEGTISLAGDKLNGRSPHEIASLGIGRTFQNMLLWRHMTVLEHVKMARYAKLSYGLIGAFFGTAKRHKEETESQRRWNRPCFICRKICEACRPAQNRYRVSACHGRFPCLEWHFGFASFRIL